MAPIDITNGQVEKPVQGISIPPQPQIIVDWQIESFQTMANSRIAKLINRGVGLTGMSFAISIIHSNNEERSERYIPIIENN